MNSFINKWFVRTLMLACTCFIFLAFNNSIAVKADDPEPEEASAVIIYASNLNEGNATESTGYSFDMPDEGYEPYAIYISPATGSAITLNASSFPDVIPDLSWIRIWNNDCQVVIDPPTEIDPFRLILAGNDAFLDIGWLHYQRSDRFNVSTYSGDGTATNIADFFNGFNAVEDQGTVNYENYEIDFYPIVHAEVTTAAKKYIYAYAPLDYDGTGGDPDGNDLQFALATELLTKFRDSYGSFGMLGDYNNPDHLSSDAGAFSERITIDFEHPVTINASVTENYQDPAVTAIELNRYTATIWWGLTENGSDIRSTVFLYQLNRPDDLLICTDFNESTGVGSTYYVRSNGDKRPLIGDPSGSPADEDFFAAVITTSSFSNVVAGGQGVSMYVKNKDRNLFTFQTISYSHMRYMDDHGAWQELNTDTFVKVFKTAGKFFATESSGTGLRYDFVSHDATGNAADKVWEAGGQYPVKLFIHDNVLHIKPLNENSGVAKALKEVRLTDPIPAAAVNINNTDPADIVITFNSNFYDSVNFLLVYSDDSTGTFKVEREGIIIQYTGLDGSGTGRYWLDIYGEGENDVFNYDYDPATENFVVMATYYHSSSETAINDLSLIVTYDDGSNEVLSSNDTIHHFNGYKSGASYGAVSTTTFIIGFMRANGTNVTFSRNGHTGGFSVQIVKSGYNDPSSFGGALAGSGKGKYWNGRANISY